MHTTFFWNQATSSMDNHLRTILRPCPKDGNASRRSGKTWVDKHSVKALKLMNQRGKVMLSKLSTVVLNSLGLQLQGQNDTTPTLHG